ncbi:MAG: ferritin-like domain-containing protein [Pseudomonadales bacterium]|jgi:hypothetical protein|nr:ferritin-like domain-containing protein [Pseudomonadales bacterium]MDP7358826.1 ferritin-like domain-containing protein [Pseudomonadales bacterium]HJN49051.1 ferritin-like domain-containing protein [Pseudomonadales bacterium]|tara:strand:- start:2548 stop:3690 length:1143 start_codon:yes stop_codon:yes gene_type:complete
MSESVTAANEDWQTSSILDAPMEICWNFSYAISQEKLANLYKKAKVGQWIPDEYLDWDTPLDPSKPIVEQTGALLKWPFFQKMSQSQRELFSAHLTAQTLSQFLHGEQGALMTASTLTHAVEDYEAKLYCATQTMDEARHVEVYKRYIDKLSMVYPMSPMLKNLIDATLQAKAPAKIMVGMNMIIEGLALAAFHNMHRQTTCPLLKKLTQGVLSDEARHVGFGNIYLRKLVQDMHSDDLEDLAEFAFDAVKILFNSQRGGTGGSATSGFAMVLQNANIDPDDFFEAMAEAREQGIKAELPPGHVHSFRDLMMPALVRAGVVTDRIRRKYEEAGIPIWEDQGVLETMENVDEEKDLLTMSSEELLSMSEPEPTESEDSSHP